MMLVDARRLNGPNLLASRPLVVVEITLEPGDTVARCVDAWRCEMARMLTTLGCKPVAEPLVRPHHGGAVIACDAPLDAMLAYAEASEWAADSAASLLRAGQPLAVEPKAQEIAAMLLRDANPRMLALAEEAARRDVPFLWDDTHVTVGEGCRSRTYPQEAIPRPERIAWETVGRIPVALITGTNGKTTSSRLLARVAAEAGHVVGSTSTEAITVGGQVIEEGDWTGPMAARTVLRRTEVELAVLETARGGILRRGLGVKDCDVALITNVTDDHLGGYGIDDLGAMTQVKGVIAQAVRPGGTAVLNAHDPKLVALAARLLCRVAYFADLDREDAAAAAVLSAHRSAGGDCVFARDGVIVRAQGEQETPLLRVDEVPITFGGAAGYNIENATGVAAAALALGLDPVAVAAGLRRFSVADNPRRGHLVVKKGVRTLLDFGHNPDGVRALMQLVKKLREGKPGRLTVIAASAGDRSNREIADVVRAMLDAQPDRVFVRELHHYMRGRAPGEVPGVFVEALRGAGFPDTAVLVADSEVDALRRAFEDAREGDFIALFLHVDEDEVRAFFDELV